MTTPSNDLAPAMLADEGVPLTFDDEPPATKDVPAEEVAVPAFDDEPPQVIDTEVSERMLTWHEGIAWLDEHAPDWKTFRGRPRWHYVFGTRWFDVRELREWIGCIDCNDK